MSKLLILREKISNDILTIEKLIDCAESLDERKNHLKELDKCESSFTQISNKIAAIDDDYYKIEKRYEFPRLYAIKSCMKKFNNSSSEFKYLCKLCSKEMPAKNNSNIQ